MDKRAILFVVSLTLALMITRMIFDDSDQNKPTTPKQQETPALATPLATPEVVEIIPEKKAESFYVLENDYVQLVFSSAGGALCEINLPFKSSEDSKSFVLPIEIDSDLAKDNPDNDQFPLHPALNAENRLVESKLGGYYPLIRRDVVGQHPEHVAARYYSCNIVSEYPELAEMHYELKEFSKDSIVFQAIQPHRRITKRFYFPEDQDKAPYCFLLDLKIEGPTHGLWLTSGVPEVEWQSGTSVPTIKYRVTKGSSYEVVKIDLPSQNFVLSSTYPDWVCNSNGFFGIIMDPLKGQEAGFKVEKVAEKSDPTRLHLLDPNFKQYSEDETAGYNLLLPIKTIEGHMSVRLFSGPFAEKVLETVDAYYASGSNTADYLSCQSFHGWFAFISEPFAKFLFFFMKLCYSLTGSWGLSIIFVTVILRVLLYPLNSWSLRSMKHMQEIGPQIKAIQDRYKKEPQKAQMEIMQLYRSKGVNPISGCLPLLLQLPFLIGMFDLLKSTFELRGACFIPGWITDLTAPDVLFSWHTSLPFIGNQFHLLPVLLGAIMYFQQNVMSNLPKDSSLWTDQQRQSRMMGNIMTVVMTVLFYNFPSGLNIYWMSSMLLGIVQQWWVTRKITDDAKEKGQIEKNQIKKGQIEIEIKPTPPKHKKR